MVRYAECGQNGRHGQPVLENDSANATRVSPQFADTSPDRLVRTATEVMEPDRLGALHQTRLSFARSLIRRMAREKWKIVCTSFEVTLENIGEAIYEVDTPHGKYSFVAFAHRIDDSQRTDRPIATCWDYTFALRDGIIDEAALAHLRQQVPEQSDARFTATELTFSRANKSVRLFDRVVDSLAEGRQPEKAWFDRVGYLIRTSAVFGNGVSGISDYNGLKEHGAFSPPFAAQMFTVYLIREFSLDLVDHLARRKNPQNAAPLSKSLRRYCGIGNATGLGMVGFLINHPHLVHRWTFARERALARVKAQITARPERVKRFKALLDRAIRHVDSWNTEDRVQANRLLQMRRDLRELREHISNNPTVLLTGTYPWRDLADHVRVHYSIETQEITNSLILEPHDDLVDREESFLIVEDESCLAPETSLLSLKRDIEHLYAWALADSDNGSVTPHYFWYRSEKNREPRLGIRGEDLGEDRALPFAVAVNVRTLYRNLDEMTVNQLREPIGTYLARRPEHRAVIDRVQTIRRYPYGELRADLVEKTFSPIDLLRMKLAFLGATKFDPKSDRWLRVTLMQGAPLREELGIEPSAADDWFCAVYEKP